MTFTLTREQYESLIALARLGVAGSPSKQSELDQWLKLIEKDNGVERDFVWVQWQELDSPLPPGTDFPLVWPPELRKFIEMIDRKVAKVDVEAVVAQYARNPMTILVTRDPGAKTGWTALDEFFVT